MARRKLTAKQEAFSQCVAGGAGTQSQCYRDIYDCDGSQPSVIHSESSRLLANPMVSARVQTLRGRIEHQKQAQTLTDSDRVLEALRKWMSDGDGQATGQDTNRIAAARLLGQASGLFKEHVITQTVDRDAESVASEIERRLEGLLVTSPEPEPEVLDSESESFH